MVGPYTLPINTFSTHALSPPRLSVNERREQVQTNKDHQGVYKRNRADLVGTSDSTLSPLFLEQLKNLREVALTAFKAATVAGLKVECYSFADVVWKARTDAEARFSDGAIEAVVTEGDASWWEEEFRLLRDEIQSVADQLRKDETKKMVNTIEDNLKEQIAEPVDLQLSKPTPEIWDNVLRTYKDTLANSERSYLRKARGFDCTDEENDEAIATLRQRAWAALRAKVDEQTADTTILTKLRTYFEERFHYDEQGVPRVWKSGDDIDGVFKKATDVTLELISLYAKIVPQDPKLAFTPPESGEDDAPGLVVLSETKALELGARFRCEADAHYVEAKRSLAVGIARIPYWVYVMFVIRLMIRSKSVFTIMVLILVASAWIIIWLNLAGPPVHVGGLIALEAVKDDNDDTREPERRTPQPLDDQLDAGRPQP